MTKIQRISTAQLFALLYISRMVINVTYNRYSTDTTNLKYAVFTGISGFLLTLLMLIPIHLVVRAGNGRNILDSTYSISKTFSVVIAIIYAFYFFYAILHTVSFFDTMVSYVFNPNLSVIILSAIGIIATIYGACKGVQTLARASALFCVMIGIDLLILICTLIPKADFLNLEPLSTDNLPTIAKMTLSALGKNACVPSMVMLIPLTNGKTKTLSVSWAFAVYASMSILTVFMVTVLGEYLYTQTFPVYTLTAVASLGVTRRLDGIFMGVWLVGMFVRVSLLLRLFSMCTEKFSGEKKAKLSIILCGGIIFIISALLSHNNTLSKNLFHPYLLLSLTLLTAVVLPLIVTVFINRKVRQTLSNSAKA